MTLSSCAIPKSSSSPLSRHCRSILSLIILLTPFAAVSQDVQIILGLQTVNLNRNVSSDIDITWLDCAMKIFPDVMYDDNSLNRSVPIRRLSRNLKPITIKQKMRIFKATDYWFEVNGELRLAMLFHLEEQYLPKAHLDVLAVYRFKPSFELVDAIDARFDAWQQDEAQLVGGFTEIETDLGGVIALMNRREIPTTSKEKHRFLALDGNKLLIIFELPVLTNKRNCFVGDISHIVSIKRNPAEDSDGRPYEMTVERNVKPIPACHIPTDFGINGYKTYRLEWSAPQRVFTRTISERGGDVIGAWGTYEPRLFVNYNPAKLHVGGGYRAQVFYNPRTGNVQLVTPGRFGHASVTFDFEDHWGLSPAEAKRSIRGTIDFQIISEETTFSADGRRQTVYHCLIHAFGKRTRYSNLR